MLETAFALHVAEESIVHKVLKTGVHVFKIVLNGGENGIFDLSYAYDGKEFNLISTEVQLLPRAWELTFPQGDAQRLGAILLSVKDAPDRSPRCVIAFGINQPFFAHVVRAK